MIPSKKQNAKAKKKMNEKLDTCPLVSCLKSFSVMTLVLLLTVLKNHINLSCLLLVSSLAMKGVEFSKF